MTKQTTDIERLHQALVLEQEASNRYLRHIAAIEHPRINAALEGFRRNEGEHRVDIENHIKRLGGIDKGVEGTVA